MVRKIIYTIFACLLIGAGLSGTVSADTHSVYRGSMSSTYVNYFKDIASNIPINDHYVCFRSDDNEYLMIVGDIEYDTGFFRLNGEGTKFTLRNTSVSGSSYNNYISYNVVGIDSFELTAYDNVLYSDLGQYPELLDKGVHYEFQTLFIIIIIGLCAFIRGILSFTYRSRAGK